MIPSTPNGRQNTSVVQLEAGSEEGVCLASVLLILNVTLCSGAVDVCENGDLVT